MDPALGFSLIGILIALLSAIYTKIASLKAKRANDISEAGKLSTRKKHVSVLLSKLLFKLIISKEMILKAKTDSSQDTHKNYDKMYASIEKQIKLTKLRIEIIKTDKVAMKVLEDTELKLIRTLREDTAFVKTINEELNTRLKARNKATRNII